MEILLIIVALVFATGAAVWHQSSLNRLRWR